MDDVERHKILSMCPRRVLPTVLVKRAKKAGVRNALQKIKKLFEAGDIREEGGFLVARGGRV